MNTRLNKTYDVSSPIVKMTFNGQQQAGANNIKMIVRFEPIQLTWLTSREIISSSFSRIACKKLTSIEITELLLNNSAFLKAAREAYNYCLQYPTHLYYGMIPIDFLCEDTVDLTFHAKAYQKYPGHESYEVQIEISDNRVFTMSKDYVKMVTVRFHKEYQQLIDLLSQREQDVLRLLGNGNTVKVAAKKLYLSTHTIESHKQNIYKKLNISSMAELGRVAERLFL